MADPRYTVVSRGMVYDSTVLAWIAASAGGPGAAGSTQVSVTSLAGVVIVGPSSTGWASSAGFHFDSSGALQIAGGAGGSTDVAATIKSGNSSVFQASSAWQVQVTSSPRINIGSTAADNLVLVSGNSTVAPLAGSVWSIQGNSTVLSGILDQGAFTTAVTGVWPIAAFVSTTATDVVHGKAGSLRMSSVRSLYVTPMDSTGGDMSDSTNRGLRVAVVAGGSTQVAITAGGVLEGSSVAGGVSTRFGLAVREQQVSSTTVAGSVAATSTGNVTLISSAATNIYVYAYNVTAESTANVTIRLMSGSTTECWRTTLECGSTAALAAGTIDRDAMVVSPPHYLFRTAAGAPLTYEKGASSAANGLVSYSFAFWRE